MTVAVQEQSKIVVEKRREFAFSTRDFNTLRELVKKLAGIDLNEDKEDMVYGRLTRRLRALNISSFKDYINMLQKDPDGEEITHFINSLTTNLTAFFRESHHFDHLKNTVLPHLMKMNAASRRIRIWSAGCSSGEEPYSIAMIVAETVPPGWDVKILATDMDSNMIDTGSSGVYAETRLAGIENSKLKRWFNKGSGNNDGMVRVKPRLREVITFKKLNLMHKWPVKGPMDVIFCRNVIIYFDNETKAALIDRYFDLLADHGTLFVGHSETLFGVTKRAKLVGKTIYEKQ